MMALEGGGVAFLPESAVVRELKQNNSHVRMEARMHGKSAWRFVCIANVPLSKAGQSDRGAIVGLRHRKPMLQVNQKLARSQR